ncbi:MAG: yqgF [Gammaproteobacteria bacterium]|jgi:putative Holliday junction resolvase|nr:yqgF [Gammaproteobacteria bacterium]
MEKNAQKILLGFDFGMKRIGVAVGQTITQTARPLLTLKANQGIPQWEMLSKLIKTWHPDALVVGIPLNMDGSAQPLTQEARKFIHSLEQRYALVVYGMDERLSTKDARERLFKQGGYKALQDGQVDSVAAQLILQNWLIENRSKSNEQQQSQDKI